eukprot:2799400-Prymnesium_polylepis.1
MSFGEGHGKTSATTPAGSCLVRRSTGRATRVRSSGTCHPRTRPLDGTTAPSRRGGHGRASRGGGPIFLSKCHN